MQNPFADWPSDEFVVVEKEVLRGSVRTTSDVSCEF